jgi:hypothetical protein
MVRSILNLRRNDFSATAWNFLVKLCKSPSLNGGQGTYSPHIGQEMLVNNEWDCLSQKPIDKAAKNCMGKVNECPRKTM